MTNSIRDVVHAAYGRTVRPLLSRKWQQRVKLIWTIWGYHPVLTMTSLPLRQRVRALRRFVRIDWNVLHAHWPGEIARAIRRIGERPARPGEVVVEAGCWQGGSTAKFSVVCQMLGYKLLVFDSFQGVEPQPGNWFSGQYAATLETVRGHLASYGVLEVCEFHPGWFGDTLARNPVRQPVRIVYIDCDLAKGTKEALQGIIRSVVDDGYICSQDYHIPEVHELLQSDATWSALGTAKPEIIELYRNLAIFARR